MTTITELISLAEYNEDVVINLAGGSWPALKPHDNNSGVPAVYNHYFVNGGCGDGVRAIAAFTADATPTEVFERLRAHFVALRLIVTDVLYRRRVCENVGVIRDVCSAFIAEIDRFVDKFDSRTPRK